MEDTKKELLGDLYAIRATLSLVAENDDEAQIERDGIASIDGQISQHNTLIADCRKEEIDELETFVFEKRETVLQELKEFKKKKVHDAEYAAWSYRRDSKRYVPDKDDYWKHIWVIVAFFIVGVIVSLVFGIGERWGLDMKELSAEEELFSIWLTIFLSVIFVPAILYFCCSFFPIMAKKRHAARRRARECDKRAAEAQKELLEAEKELNELKELKPVNISGTYYVDSVAVHHCHEEAQKQIDIWNQEISALQAKITLHEKEIRHIAAKSQEIIDGAVKAYPAIDLRDWENVDLLIYYFETGRADDMKEALQLVDRQRQTDQITQALAMATAEIGRTIHQSIVVLGDSLTRSFDRLSHQFAVQHEETMRGMKWQSEELKGAMEKQTAAIENRAEAQISSQDMNRALLEKIQTSSNELVDQMKRQLSELKKKKSS